MSRSIQQPRPRISPSTAAAHLQNLQESVGLGKSTAPPQVATTPLQETQGPSNTWDTYLNAPPANPQEAMIQMLAQMVQNQNSMIAHMCESSGGSGKPKAAEPEDFSGKREDVDAFIRQCEVYYLAGNYSDKQKVVVALSHIKKGPAAIWAQDQVDRAPIESSTWNWASWKDNFKRLFGDPDKKLAAQYKLQSIKQDKRSAEEYIGEFEVYAQYAQFGEEAELLFFMQGLDGPLYSKVANLDYPPVNLEDWKRKCRRVDEIWRRNQEFQKKFRKDAPKQGTSSSNFGWRAPAAAARPQQTAPVVRSPVVAPAAPRVPILPPGC